MRTLILSAALAASAALANAQPAAAQAGGKEYCLRSPTGSMSCRYDTMAQCEQARGGRDDVGGCVPNPDPDITTGRGGAEGGGSIGRPPERPPGGMDTPDANRAR